MQHKHVTVGISHRYVIHGETRPLAKITHERPHDECAERIRHNPMDAI